jgi:thioredoxin 1
MNKIIEVGATWCGPCHVYKPTFEEVSKMEDFKDITFESFDADTDEGNEITQKYNIKGVPTTLFLKDNELVDRLTGNMPKDILIEKINKNFSL